MAAAVQFNTFVAGALFICTPFCQSCWRRCRRSSRAASSFRSRSAKISRSRPWNLLLPPFQNQLHFRFRHRLPNILMNDIAAKTVQYTAQVVKGSTQIDIRNIHMPVRMRPQGLDKSGPAKRGFLVPTTQKPSLMEHPTHAGRTYCYDVGIQHHKGQSAISICAVFQVIGNDRLLLPILQPKIPWNPPLCSLTLP